MMRTAIFGSSIKNCRNMKKLLVGAITVSTAQSQESWAVCENLSPVPVISSELLHHRLEVLKRTFSRRGT